MLIGADQHRTSANGDVMLAWGMGVVAEVLEIVVAIAVLVKWVVNSLLGHLTIRVGLVVTLGG